jgi:hypothetical protein
MSESFELPQIIENSELKSLSNDMKSIIIEVGGEEFERRIGTRLLSRLDSGDARLVEAALLEGDDEGLIRWAVENPSTQDPAEWPESSDVSPTERILDRFFLEKIPQYRVIVSMESVYFRLEVERNASVILMEADLLMSQSPQDRKEEMREFLIGMFRSANPDQRP